jgi:hypothetical protein
MYHFTTGEIIIFKRAQSLVQKNRVVGHKYLANFELNQINFVSILSSAFLLSTQYSFVDLI